MSSLMKTPALESASADPATSVSASAGTNTSVPPQASTSTTEYTLIVDGYHALQYKQRVEDKAAAPETILEGSLVWNTDGSMPTDYGSDISDVPMEDEEVPSSAADSESAAVAHEPVTGSRRPREDDPSASSSKRSRNDDEDKAPTLVTPSSPRSALTERAPWMPSASEIARITAAQQRFETFSRRHMIDRLHNEAMEAGIPCAVPFGTACSHCPPGAERLTERDVTGYTTVRVPIQLRDLRVQLEPRDERRDTPSVSGDRSARAGVTPALRSGLGTPSPFPERPPSERSEVPMYLGGEEILSNEYEDEPDLGSSSGVHSPRFA
ncbi:hypothetical protein PC128_g15890 [Phytophthora cactorum]|nr:hypothetical protein PC128_g15890 [Phytophthora cactorum]